MTQITLLGGSGEVGGNKILVKDKDAAVFFDFGMSFDAREKYYNDFLGPRSFSCVGDLYALGIIPQMENLYRDDPVGGIPMTGKDPAVQAVYLTHCHSDHAGHISLLHPNIPIYTTEETWGILAATAVTGQSGTEREIVQYSFRECHKYRYEKHTRKMVPLGEGQTTEVGSIKVTSYPVDHIVPGAVGFLIETSAGIIAYTGDFRLHGSRPDLTTRFLQAVKAARPKVLLIEGTNVGVKKGRSEEQVGKDAEKILHAASGKMAFCMFSLRDLERLGLFRQIAEREGRRLVVGHKTAYLLEMLQNFRTGLPKLDDVTIYNPRKKWGLYEPESYEDWEKSYVGRWNSVRAETLARTPEEYLIHLDFYSFPELIDIKDTQGAVLIHSKSEPFKQEMELDHKRLMRWLDLFGITYKHTHASGHMYGDSLAAVIEEMDPEVVIPVHTEKPGEFLKMSPKTKILGRNETYIL